MPCGIDLPLRRGGGRVLRIERGAADQLVAGQLGEAGLVGAGAGQFGFRRGELRLRRAGLRGEVAGIEHGQQVALAHMRADIDFAPEQLAGDAERQRALLAGADLAGIGGERRFGTAARAHDQHRARRFHRGFVAAAGGQ